jgi:hypothetical protein
MNRTGAALPVGASINPRRLAQSDLWDAGWVAYVLFKTSEARTRPTRVYTSHGSLGWKLGDTVSLWHDQTGVQLGIYKVTGITYADPANGLTVGDVPDIKIKHCVAK